MNRFLITFLAGTLSTLSAAEYDPESPTQQHESNRERLEEKIADNKARKNSVFGHLALLDHSDQRDLLKPESDSLKAFQAQKELSRIKYAQELKKLKRDLRKLSKEKQRLESTQIF